MELLREITEYACDYPGVFWFAWYTVGVFTFCLALYAGMYKGKDGKDSEVGGEAIPLLLFITTFWPAFLGMMATEYLIGKKD